MVIKINKDKCKGCSICVSSCPFNAMEMENKLAVVGSGCTGCGVCAEKCPFGAIEEEEQKEASICLEDYNGVWVFAEQREGNVMPVVYELLGEGRKLANQLGTELSAVICGYNIDSQIKELFAYGADKVYVADSELLKTYRTDAYTKVIYDAISKYKPEAVLLGASHIGRDLGPCLAVKAGTGLTADCTELEIDVENHRLQQTRPAFGGNLMATIICPNHRPQMSTVRPGVMAKGEYQREKIGEVIKLDINITEDEIATKVLEIVKDLGEKVSLTDAEFIVAGGMGIGKQEGFDLLQKLADKLGGVIASTRACVDAGWIDPSYQIGQTGTTVKPKIYFACGISGAIQHLSGMQDSDYIVAINKNEVAPIFEVADYGIVGDLYKVIPELIAAIDK